MRRRGGKGTDIVGSRSSLHQYGRIAASYPRLRPREGSHLDEIEHLWGMVKDKTKEGEVQLISFWLGLSTLASICRTIERCLFESKEDPFGARNESLLLKIARLLSSSPTATAAAATSAHSTFFLWNLILGERPQPHDQLTSLSGGKNTSPLSPDCSQDFSAS
jgi:hypothetical protein